MGNALRAMRWASMACGKGLALSNWCVGGHLHALNARDSVGEQSRQLTAQRCSPQWCWEGICTFLTTVVLGLWQQASGCSGASTPGHLFPGTRKCVCDL